MSDKIRLRFAPSPTGQVHIGNIRTAISNWLYARHCDGQFLLRIEDTDRERSTPEAIEALLEVMDWLGLNYDEEPLYQSARADAHIAAAEKLLDSKNAYRFAKGEGGEAVVFRIPWNAPDKPFVRKVGPQSIRLHPDVPVVLDQSGIKYAVPSKKGKPVEQTACLAGFRDLKILDDFGTVLLELESRIDGILDGDMVEVLDGARLDYTRYEVFYEDLVKGTLSKPLDSMKDQVIIRSNGTPVFHLANVCDDSYQKVTHIVRGDDHVENTYRHIFLFDALGDEPPQYAHLPMIVNKQGKPYSKRDGDAFVGDFRAKGFLADALFNYLTLLGWSPGDDREKMTRDELIEAFDLDRVRSVASQMDPMKLTNLNGQYLAEMPFDQFCEEAKHAIEPKPWFSDVDDAYFRKVADLMQSRTKLFTDVESWSYFFTEDFEYDEKQVRKAIQKEGMADILGLLLQNLSDVDFTIEEVETAIHQTTDRLGLKQGKLNLPIRVAVTGTNIGAGLYETMTLLGREKSMARIQNVIDKFTLED